MILVDSLPRTSLGKIAYPELDVPAEDALGAPPRGARHEPRDRIEREVAALWSSLLGHESVPLDVGFTELGGTSVHLVRFHERLAARYGDALELVDLFRHPTVEELSRHLMGLADEQDERSLEEAARRAERMRDALADRRRPPASD